MMTLLEQRTRWLVTVAGVVVRLASARRIMRPGGKILAANPLLVKEHE
jgi:hypothetical protein